MALSACIVGAGKIGLGLLHPWMAAIGVPTVLVNRRAVGGVRPYRDVLATTRAYTVRQPDREDFAQNGVSLVEYTPDDLLATGSRAAVKAVADCDVVLVSVGVTNVAQVAELIAEACRDAGRGPLHLLAFENSPRASEGLARHVRNIIQASPRGPSREIVPHLTVTDRACDMNKKAGAVTVESERYGEIVLSDSAASLFRACDTPAPPAPVVRIVPTGAIDLFEFRKFWFVNGTHVVLGMIAERMGGSGFRLADALRDSDTRQFLVGLHSEWIAVLSSIARGKGYGDGALSERGLSDFSELMFSRLEDLQEWTVANVLREMVDIHEEQTFQPRDHLFKLARLLQKFDERLACEVREGRRAVIPTPHTAFALADSVEVVGRYVDRYITPQ